jgi:hypothetical protein
MNARRIVIVGRLDRRLLGCALGAMLALGPAMASAQGNNRDPCNSNVHQQPIPNCQNQVQVPLHYSGQTGSEYLFYCMIDHKYFYHLDGAWSIDNSNAAPQHGFTGYENPRGEAGTTNEMDGTFFNWSDSANDLIVTLACSDTPQPPSD